jgi:hypothetical protein
MAPTASIVVATNRIEEQERWHPVNPAGFFLD